MKKYKMKKSVILISVAGTLLLIIALVLVGRNVKEKKANTLVITEEHVRAYAHGFNGFGVLNPCMDRMLLYEDVMKIYEAHPDEDRTKNYLGALDLCFEFKVDKTTELSNGDMIEIEVIPDELKFKEMGIYVKSEKFVFEVEYLEDLEDFDPFEETEMYLINYESGPEYKLVFYGEEKLFVDEKDIEYAYSKDGTAITVSIKEEVVEELTQKGIPCEETKREYLIEDIEYLYVTNYKEMSKNLYNLYKFGGDNNIEDAYKEFSDVLTIESIEYYGGWITTYKNADYINKVVGVYELKAYYGKDNSESITMYVCCEAYDYKSGVRSVLYSGGPFLVDLENRCTVVIDKRNYNLYGSDKLSDLFEKSDYLTVDFDPNGNISGFEGLK